MAFSIASEIERDLVSKRTKAGLAAARAAGKQLGRPKGPGKSKLDPYREEIIALLKNGSSKKFVANRYNCSQVNLYNWGMHLSPVHTICCGHDLHQWDQDLSYPFPQGTSAPAP